ncbi:MAG: hypothetical protein ACLP9L_08620 [Thermoguttaceae bacterium]
MVNVPCDIYSDGHLVATNLMVWLRVKKSPSRDGMFHVPTNFEVLTGAKYHLELLGERAKLLEMPGKHSMDVLITEVSGQIAQFTSIAPAG